MRRPHYHAVATISGREAWSPPFDTRTAAQSRADSIRNSPTRVEKCVAVRDEHRFGTHCIAERLGSRS